MNMPEEKPALKAIRLKCLDCSGGSAQEVELCALEDCPLFPFRSGTMPASLEQGAGARQAKRGDGLSRALLLPGIDS